MASGKGFKLALIGLLILKINNCNSQDFIFNILKNELAYQTEKFQNQKDKPYFIQFNVAEVKIYEIKSSFGSINSSNYNHFRFFSPEVRIGNYQLDNTHIGESNLFSGGFAPRSFPQILPIEDSLFATSFNIRASTEKAYTSALEGYKQKNKNYNDEKVKSKKSDFSKETPCVYYDNIISEVKFDKEAWEKRLKEITAFFNKEAYIEDADADIRYLISRDYTLNTENSSIVQNSQTAQLNIILMVKCSDNNVAPISKSFYAYTPDRLPGNDELKKVLIDIKNLAIKLKNAPSADAFSGPCILSSGAAGVLFHEIFGHRVEGHRLNLEMDAQTLKDKIGDKILPEFLTINFDPTVQTYGNTDLFGYYQYDDQAVKARKVQVVKNGKLIQFLMCRTPIDSIINSNGHGRAAFGFSVVSRQSNMFIESSKTVSESQLKEQLVKMCKKKKLEYGLYFKEVAGGFTNTSKFQPNVFNIIPTEVYKIYADGRPDELVKGVSLIGTPLTLFSEITTVGDKLSVFNGYCVAESGAVPVSTIAPSLLLNKIETQKTYETKDGNQQIARPDILK